MRVERFRIGKVDVDTVGAGFLLGAKRGDEVIVVDGASQEELRNLSIFCIEVGGTGWLKWGNFDHHGEVLSPLRIIDFDSEQEYLKWKKADFEFRVTKATILGELPERRNLITREGIWITEKSLEEWEKNLVKELVSHSATFQVWYLLRKVGDWLPNYFSPIAVIRSAGYHYELDKIPFVDKEGKKRNSLYGTIYDLVAYIDILDIEGAEVLKKKKGYPGFPTLSDLFGGMLLVEKDPLEQFFKGVEFLREVCDRQLRIFDRIPLEVSEWKIWAEAKEENKKKVAEALRKARWGKTKSGLKLAWLETEFPGAVGALYGGGAQIVVVFNPKFGPSKVPKFTIAGNGIRVDNLLPHLNAQESGWGGPTTGTIIGSPREGSRLSLEEVLKIVIENL